MTFWDALKCCKFVLLSLFLEFLLQLSSAMLFLLLLLLLLIVKMLLNYADCPHPLLDHQLVNKPNLYVPIARFRFWLSEMLWKVVSLYYFFCWGCCSCHCWCSFCCCCFCFLIDDKNVVASCWSPSLFTWSSAVQWT